MLPERQPIGADLRARLQRAIDGILARHRPWRAARIELVIRRRSTRKLYVDPLNPVQVELLRRVREQDDPRTRGADGDVNGIAAGMREYG